MTMTTAMPNGKMRLALLAAAAALMVVPVAVMRRAEGHVWDPGDAMFLAILLGGLAAAFEVAARVPGRRAYGFGTGLAVLTGLLQAWINLAVGVIGTEDNPANLIYAGVIAVAAGGAVVARFQAAGMARAMIAAALAQAAAFVVGLAAGLGFTGPITMFFCGLWLVAAWLFRRAEREQASA